MRRLRSAFVALGLFVLPSITLVLSGARTLPDAQDICCQSTGCDGGPVQCATITTPSGSLTCYKGAGLGC